LLTKDYTTSEIFIDGHATDRVITLKISKNTLSSIYTLEIEIDLNLYQGDVRDLLRTLIESFGDTTYPPKDAEKVKNPLSLSFLLGLADIPERNGDKAYTAGEITNALTGKIDDNVVGTVNPSSIEGLKKLEQQISKLGDSDRKCVIIIELSQNDNSIIFTVKRYPRISYKDFSYKVRYWDPCKDHDEYDCEGGFTTTTRIVYYPILIDDADATPISGIKFMNWKQPPLVEKELYSFFPGRVGNNKFSIKGKTIEDFVTMMRQPRKLQLREDGPKIVVVDSQPQPSATTAPEPEAAAATTAPAPEAAAEAVSPESITDDV
jgi:hypothetical protein